MIDKLLLVDDDEVSNFVTERTITSSWENVKVTTVTNGQLAANYLIENDDPDVILLDLNMPLMNGIEFLETLENDNIHSKAKVVILSTSNRKQDREAAMKFKSVIGYIEKPISTIALEKIINS